MRKLLLLLSFFCLAQPTFADPILTFRVPDDPKTPLQGTPVYKSGKVTFADGRVCDRCKVSAVFGFVTAVVDKTGNNWPLTPGLIKVDIHPIWGTYSEAIRQSETLRIQQTGNYTLNVNPASAIPNK